MRTAIGLIVTVIGFSLPSYGDAPEREKFRVIADHFEIFDLTKMLRFPGTDVHLGILSMHDLAIYGNEIVGSSAQYVGPAQVEGTWIHVIYSRTGQVLYATGEVIKDPPRKLRMQAEVLAHNLDAAKEVLRKRVNAAKSAVEVFPPRVAIIWNERRKAYIPHWYIEYLTQKSDIRFARISSSGEVISEGIVPVSGSDGVARVYPKGPRLSELGEERLHGLVGDGTLNSAVIKLSSALNLNLNSPEEIFFFDVQEPRFEAVQAYYSVDRALSWFREEFGANLQEPLKVRVHVGENGPSNAAFYHDNQVYLGSGDGELYRDMLKDPTVVMHETAHALIQRYAGLPVAGEGGSLNEGFADLFTALILDHPHMGEVSWIKGPYRRTVDNDFMAYRDFTSGLYRNGSIVAGTFWDMRKVLGKEKTAKIAFRTLVRLGPSGTFNDFVPSVLSAAASFLSAEDMALVAKAVADRGWRTIDGL
jgi:hypothetical protein